jgi:hypothetical protein
MISGSDPLARTRQPKIHGRPHGLRRADPLLGFLGRNGFVAFEVKYSESMSEPITELNRATTNSRTQAASLLIPPPWLCARTRCNSSGANISSPKV